MIILILIILAAFLLYRRTDPFGLDPVDKLIAVVIMLLALAAMFRAVVSG